MGPSKAKKRRKRKQRESRRKPAPKATQVPSEGEVDSESLAELRESRQREMEERYRRKVLKRQLRDEFHELLTGECDLATIAAFIGRFEDSELLGEALEHHKGSASFAAMVVWGYLLGEGDEELCQLVADGKLLSEREAWLEARLPDPITIQVETTEDGPAFDALGRDEVRDIVGQIVEEAIPSLRIAGSFPFSGAGEHTIELEFSEGLVLSRTARVELRLEPLPQDCVVELRSARTLDIPGTVSVLSALEQALAEAVPSDILTYYPGMSNVLWTAYRSGYWSSPWVQGVLREWRSRREEYVLNLQLHEVGELVERLNRRGPWTVPEQLDTDALTEHQVLDLARSIVSSDADLSGYSVDLALDDDLDRTVLKVDVLLEQLPVGTLRLIRSGPFMPRRVRQEILQAEIEHLTRMLACQSDEELLRTADEENQDALRIADEAGRANYAARSRYLAGICRVLLQRGHVEEVQFKRTLTCFYAARGGEFFTEDPLVARRYYLLFFRMLYEERMLQHLKAIAPFDYWVLAGFFATYASSEIRNTWAPRDVRSLETSQPMAPMLWRAAQLLHDSPEQFFHALLDLYLIEPDFIRDFLLNLRRLRRKGFFALGRRIRGKWEHTLDDMNVESGKLLTDIVAYSLGQVSDQAGTSLLLGFVLAVLDMGDIVEPVLNDFRRLLGFVRQFMEARDVVQKSALYTDVDREFLQVYGVARKIAGRQARGTEETRRKAGRLIRLLDQIKAYVDHQHREFFRSARLKVVINTFTLPRNELSPVEIRIANADFGPASGVSLELEKDSSFHAKDHSVALDPIYGKEERIEALYISPLADKAVEIRGGVTYSDQEEKNKTAAFQHTINVSDPMAFSPFHSPYITGDPVRNSEMFFGRRDELDETIRSLIGHFQDRITVIHGRRKVGKTSLLFQLKEGDPSVLGVAQLAAVQENYVPVLVDFERFTAKKPTWEVYYHIYGSVRRELDVAGISSLSTPMADFRDLSPDALLEEFIVQQAKPLNDHGRKLLLMFDEFDTLIRSKGEETGLFGFIREMIVKHGQFMSFIFVGADQLVGMMMQRANRLYSMAGTPIEIADLAPEEARLLVTEPIRKANPSFEWAEDAVRLIVHVTARNPYYIQTLCDRVVNNLIAGKRLRATTVDVQQGVTEAVDHIGDLADIVDSLESAEERIVLTSVAGLTWDDRMGQRWTTAGETERMIADSSRKFPRDAIPGILRGLQARYILDQREGDDMEMKYSIQVPLLQMYVRNRFGLKDVLREGGYA